nr:hypothetical protein [uncultured Allomuricauda sp.]
MKKWRMFLQPVILLICTVVLIACNREGIYDQSISVEDAQANFDYDLDKGATCVTNEEEPISAIDYEGSITLGNEIKIPQTIENMQRAWEKLRDRGLYPEVENPVKVNRLYVRFLPKSQNQVLELSRYDKALDLFGFPLHYEFESITDENDSYRDRTLPLETPNPLYTVVNHDYIFPSSIPYEIIEELYMPDEDRTIPPDLADNLELVAENIAEGKSTDELSKTSKKWRPEGRIRVVDHAQGEPTDGMAVPVKGVQVMARRGLKWSWGITDEYGVFRVKKDFKKEVNYSLRWSNHEWYIIKGSSVTRAWYFGPKKEGEWDSLIDGSIQSYYAQIHRGAYHSYYGENYGITRPMHNKPGNDRMWIRAHKKASILGYVAHFYENVPHAISVFAKAKGGEWLYGENFDENHHILYSSLMHEFGHASQRNLFYMDNQLKWKNLDRIVGESWATGIAVELIKEVYPNYHSYFLDWSECAYVDNPYYTSYVVKDLIHPNGNDDGFDPNNPQYEANLVEFTLKEIEDVMGHTWSEWRENLKQGLPKAKADNVQDRFDYWITVCD